MNFLRVSTGVVILAAAIGLIVESTPAQPGGDLKKSVKQIADLFRAAAKDKSEPKDAKVLAAKTAKGITETTELMAMFRLHSKGGLGVGAVAGSNMQKDGIEVMIREMARTVPPTALRNPAALEEMGYLIAAMGAIVEAKGPPKDDEKSKKVWHEYAHDAHVMGLAFAKAAATKNPATIKMAAFKVNNACGGCHAFFK